MRYALDLRLTVQSKASGEWEDLKPAQFGDLYSESNWTRFYPVRVNLITKRYCAVATNLVELKDLLDQVKVKQRVPYHVGKRAEIEQAPRLKPPEIKGVHSVNVFERLDENGHTL